MGNYDSCYIEKWAYNELGTQITLGTHAILILEVV